ncbi:MAG: RNA polymerase sigma factor [Desulfosarcinaceae bacterium]
MNAALEDLVAQARNGNRGALEQLVAQIRDRVYGLAMRMLSHPSDAEDATQEILIKTVTHLGQFRGEWAFSTWVYRIACNHLLTTRKRRAERLELTFDACRSHIEASLAAQPSAASPEAEQGLIVEEMMLACTQAILLCLDRGLRLAYILGEVLGFASQQGAEILEISPAAFRKRLSRARDQVRTFMRRYCGLVDANNRCRCARLIPQTTRRKWLDPGRLLFSNHPRNNPHAGIPPENLENLEPDERIKVLFRSHPDYIAPLLVSEVLAGVMHSVRWAIQGSPSDETSFPAIQPRQR